MTFGTRVDGLAEHRGLPRCRQRPSRRRRDAIDIVVWLSSPTSDRGTHAVGVEDQPREDFQVDLMQILSRVELP